MVVFIQTDEMWLNLFIGQLGLVGIPFLWVWWIFQHCFIYLFTSKGPREAVAVAAAAAAVPRRRVVVVVVVVVGPLLRRLILRVLSFS